MWRFMDALLGRGGLSVDGLEIGVGKEWDLLTSWTSLSLTQRETEEEKQQATMPRNGGGF